MKQIKRSVAVAFLVELGFSKADTYDNERLAKRLSEVPGRLTKDAVTASFVPTFQELEAADGKVEVVDDPAEEKKQEAPAAKTETKKPAAKAAKAKPAPKTETKKPAAKAAKAKPAPKTETKKPAAKAPAKKEAKEKPAKDEQPKDRFGYVQGSVRSNVSLAVDSDWHTDEEVAEKAGAKRRQARIQLRRMVREGLVQKRRRVEYCLVQKAKK